MTTPESVGPSTDASTGNAASAPGAEDAADAPAKPDSSADAARSESSRRPRFVPALTLPGLIGALVFATLSFLPSLLPRSGLFQGLITGITAAFGYGLGVAVAWAWREMTDRDVRPTQQRSWRILLVVALVALPLGVYRGQQWQGELRDLMDVPTPGPTWVLVLPLVAVSVFLLVIGIGRGVRAIYRFATRVLNRWIAPRASRVIGWALVAVLVVTFTSGVLFDGLVRFADQTFSVNNGNTKEGSVEPTSALRSGSPESLISWESLGREGRAFVGTGPDAADISSLTGDDALDPVRSFAGLESADSAESRAQLAVEDLERAGGFERSALMVATTTGSGWVDPASVDSFEYLNDGDSAIVAMQYSYLPSWISFLVDQDRAREAGRELFDAVYARWLQLPEADRPELYVFGESLGSFGGETAFSGEYDLRNRTDGVLFAGPPNSNTLWNEFTAARDEGTPEYLPTFREGRTVRFASEPNGEIPPVDREWEGTRVLYLQHSSDPIVWWSPGLLFEEPDWLDEARGPDVLEDVVWAPFVTFWGVTMDMTNATSVPSGHGHKYSREHVDAWNEILRADADEEFLAKLRDTVDPG